MTREEAITILNMVEAHGSLVVQAKDMAIKALEQEPCDNAISRQAVLELVGDYDLSMGQVVKGIHALPPVTPQPKIGHWIRWYEQKEHDGCIEYRPHCKCSECGKEYDSHSSRFINYCNECGAKMVESEDS